MSLKSKLGRMKERIFTNRVSEVQLFVQALTLPDPLFNIVNLYGIGGVGKSFLVNEFVLLSQSHGIPVAVIDGSHTSSIPEIVGLIKDQLGGKKYFKQLEGDIKRYYGIRGKLQSILGPSAGIALAGLKEANPIAKVVVEGIGEENIKAFIQKTLSQSDAGFYLSADRQLTTSLIKGVNDLLRAQRQHKVVLVFDTYERLASIDAWLRDTLLGGDLSAGVILVVSGREPLGGLWSNWRELIRPFELRSFNREDAVRFLQKRNVTDPLMVDQIIQDSEGFPWALALEADIEEQATAAPERTANREIARRRIVERFLDQVTDRELRQLIEVCAVVRSFDEDILRFLLKRDDVSTDFSIIQGLSFVRPNAHGKQAIHDNVREYITHDLRLKSHERWAATNLNAAAYYRNRLSQPGQSLQDVEGYSLEYLYHLLRSGETQAANELLRVFESALAIYNLGFCSALLSLAEDDSLRDPVRAMFRYLRGRLMFARSEWPEAQEILGALLSDGSLGPEFDRPLVLYLGIVNENLGNLEEAHSNLQRYVEMSRIVGDTAGIGRGLVELADTCWLLGRIDQERTHLTEAVSLLDSVSDHAGAARALLGLEHLYRYTGQWEMAFAACSRAVQIAEQIDDAWIKARGLYGLGRYYTAKGRLRRADESLRASQLLFERLEFRQRVADVKCQWSIVLYLTGRHQEADNELHQSIAIHQELEAIRDIGYDHVNLALTWFHARDLEKARQHAAEALRICERTKYTNGVALANKLLGLIASLLGQPKEAEEHLLRALRDFQRLENPYQTIDAALGLADLYLRIGSTDMMQEYLILSEASLVDWMIEQKAHLQLIKGKELLLEDDLDNGCSVLADAAETGLMQSCYCLDEIVDEILRFATFLPASTGMRLGKYLIARWHTGDENGRVPVNTESDERLEQRPLPVPRYTYIERIRHFTSRLEVNGSV